MPNFEFEKFYWQQYKYIAGIDEAGRGAIAGPVVAAAVILSSNIEISPMIDDSKKLSPAKRSDAYEFISKSFPCSTGTIDNTIIDKTNILAATMEAMHTSIKSILPSPDFLLIDGNYFKECELPYRTIIKGDAKSLSIAAASIIAKVSRDNYMINIADKLYPHYGFSIHKGYGTKEHIENIKKYGISPIHRKSFLSSLFPEPSLFD